MRARQRTIARPASARGVGLHSGEPVRLTLRPAAPGRGLRFRRADRPGTAALTPADERSDGLPGRTALARDGVSIWTVEHLLAAAAGLGVDNLEAEVEGPELPAGDGSAREFVELLERAGIVEQPEPLEVWSLPGPIEVRSGPCVLRASPLAPGELLRITYTLHYPDCPLAQGTGSFVLDPGTFAREIAPARTFCLAGEVEKLLAAGLGRGATEENTLVLDGTSVRGNTLRFPDEPLRHKVLDLVGDLALLGAPLSAHVVGVRSGHELNRRLAREVRREGRRVPVKA